MVLLNSSYLSVYTLAAGVGTCCFAYFVVTSFLTWHKYRHFPGPWHCKISNLWMIKHTLKGDVYEAMAKKIKEYGHIVQLAPHLIMNDDPDLYRLVTVSKSPFCRGQWYRCAKLDPRMDNITSIPTEKEHADRRTRLIPGYTGKEVPTLESDVDAQVVKVIDLIRREYVTKTEKFDMAPLIGYFTLDSLSKIAYNEPIGYLSANRDLHNYFKTSEAFFPVMALGGNVPWVMDILHSRLVLWLVGPKPGNQVGLGALITEAFRVVGERYQPDYKIEEDHTMIGSFVRHGLTREECESESTMQILAGSDSTAAAIRNTIIHLLSNPVAYNKLSAEINSAVEAGNVSFPVIKNTEAQSLPYLQACIKEGIRIFTPLNGLGTRRAPPEGVEFKGMHIPGGTEVGMTHWTMLRRTDIFGPDADTFRPERWLEGEPDNIVNMDKVRQLIFGNGWSACLGKDLAYMELGKVIFEMFKDFDMTLVNPLQGVQMSVSAMVVMHGMWVRAWEKESK